MPLVSDRLELGEVNDVSMCYVCVHVCVCVCVPDGEIGVLEDMCVAVAELSTIKIQVSISAC